MSRKRVGALLPEDVTSEESEEMDRQVRDLVNYLANYDDSSYREQLRELGNPKGVLILIQSEKKFERGSATDTDMVAVGTFNPVALALAVRDWLKKTEETALMGREIK